MNKFDEVKMEIKELVEEGYKLTAGLTKCADYYSYNTSLKDKEKDSVVFFINNYEIWFSKVLLIVKKFLPDRYSDFYSLYKDERRREITGQNYTISDAIQGQDDYLTFSPKNAIPKMMQQVSILKTCLEYFDKRIFDIETVLQADIFDSEIESAKHLLKMGFLRASGAVSGVVLEKHFSNVCTNRNISISKKNPTIADYNDALKDKAYDTLEWRRVQRLGDIRNLCDHNKDREPTKEEVEELILGTDRVIKTVF